ncbi:hypothetical protein WA158_006535 [Blastocystis sp. Blastoise]
MIYDCNQLLKIIGAILFYWCISISSIFANKWVYSCTSYINKAPLFVTFIQTGISALLFFLVKRVYNRVYNEKSLSFQKTLFRLVNVFPLSLSFVLMLLFSNLCLKSIPITYYQIVRSLSLPMIPFFLYILLHEKTPWKTLLSCIIILSGYFYGIKKENDISIYGILYGLLSSIFGSLYTIYIKQYQQKTNISTITILLDLHFESCLLLPIGTGVLGCLVSFSTFLQIKLTSSLTHNVSGIMKNCVQTVLGSYIFHSPLHKATITSTAIISLGSLLYAATKLSFKSNHIKYSKINPKSTLDTPTIVVESQTPR